MIGVVVAHPKELSKFHYLLLKEESINQFKFYTYEIKNKKVVVVLSGVGIANSAAATQELISTHRVKEVWNYGAVGGNKYVDVYDIVTPNKIFYHDVITPWYSRGETPGESKFYTNSLKLLKTNNLASGSSFVDSKEDIISIKKDLDADIFDMEGAAIAQICKKNNIPLKMIKCVSDSIGHTNVNDHEDILDRIEKAGMIAFNKMMDII